MGGNLYKLGRLPKEEYLKIETKIRAYLDEKVGKDNYGIPRYYGDKPDFGDVDIILRGEVIKPDWQRYRMTIVEDLGIERYKSEGAVFSTVFDNFQVDYFVRNTRYFDSTLNFLHFNDIGNIIGKILRRFNLKYGMEGLTYLYRPEWDGHFKREVVLTQDMEKILNLIGLDYNKWLAGFESLEDMFRWVIQSPYFSVTPYIKPLKKVEKRADERTTIRKFIDFLKENNITKEYKFKKRYEYFDFIVENFPEANLPEKLKTFKLQYERGKFIKSKFNGRIIMEMYPNLVGEELGEFIVKFKNQFDEFDLYVEKSSKATIRSHIKELYDKTYE